MVFTCVRANRRTADSAPCTPRPLLPSPCALSLVMRRVSRDALISLFDLLQHMRSRIGLRGAEASCSCGWGKRDKENENRLTFYETAADISVFNLNAVLSLY